MKELRNNVDSEARFSDLTEAKHYYYPSGEMDAEEYIGEKDFKTYLANYEKYRAEIAETENLEELADVLNKYTDEFGNGSEYFINI